MRALNLRAKVIGGFLVLAVITLGVGFIGWHGTRELGDSIEDITEAHLPAIQASLRMSKDFESVRVAQRTLLNPGLEPEDRRRQYVNLTESMEKLDKDRAEYERLPVTPEETAAWKLFIDALDSWRKENDVLQQIAKELDQTGVFNPPELKAKLELFRGDHLRLLKQAAEFIHTQVPFAGGEDPTQCAFGKWLAAYRSNNPEISQAMNEIMPYHRTFHLSVEKIKKLVAAGDLEASLAVYREEMNPAAEETFKRFEVMHAQAATATALFEKLSQQTMVNVYARQTAAQAQLEKLVRTSRDEMMKEKSRGLTTASQMNHIALGGMGAGSILAVILGIILSISITRPILRVIQGLSNSTVQVVAASRQLSSASQGLAEGASE